MRDKTPRGGFCHLRVEGVFRVERTSLTLIRFVYKYFSDLMSELEAHFSIVLLRGQKGGQASTLHTDQTSTTD